MKYGQQLESESVPEWSLHNIDYNTLKEFIKIHTTRDQATAIAIPGQPDTSLHRFENDFYDELCRQHDRVGLFVTTKANEIGRRMQHISDQVHTLILRSASNRGSTSVKRQRRFAKYDRATMQLGDEIRDLSRFVNAQIVAFRKILKKYRKWTGSSSLGARFKDNVLSDPKSFTKRDFSQLESQCDELLGTVRAATPFTSSPAPQTPDTSSVPGTPNGQRRRSSAQLFSSSSSTLHALSSSAGSIVPPLPHHASSDRPRHAAILASAPAQTHYWNEYDDGSENGDMGGLGNDNYAIYLQPSDEAGFPGMTTLVSFFTVPIQKARDWMSVKRTPAGHDRAGYGEHEPLMSHAGGYGTNGPAGASAVVGGTAGGIEYARQESRARARLQNETADEGEASGSHHHDGDADDDDDPESSEGDGDGEGAGEDVFASDGEFPLGYETHYAAFPSVEEQRIARYRESMLARGAVGCFAAAAVLLGVAGILIATGRHKMRVEVDAGVTMGVVTSLGFACAALGLVMAKHNQPPLASQLVIYGAFATICILNGVVLVCVMGNTSI